VERGTRRRHDSASRQIRQGGAHERTAAAAAAAADDDDGDGDEPPPGAAATSASTAVPVTQMAHAQQQQQEQQQQQQQQEQQQQAEVEEAQSWGASAEEVGLLDRVRDWAGICAAIIWTLISFTIFPLMVGAPLILGIAGCLLAGPAPPLGESKRLLVESPWSQFTSECQRF
jgi:hypothetical protein